MKTSLILLSSILLLAACKKDEKVLPKTTTPATSSVVSTTSTSTMPDTAMLRIKLTSSANANDYDETMLVFHPNCQLCFDANMDAPYFAGFGMVSLSSITDDGRNLAIYGLPYTPGMKVALNVKANADGAFSLGIDFEKKIPANIQVWVKDTYLKDSTNVITGNYNFTMAKADTNSFGNKRFQLIIKDGGQQTTQTVAPN